MRTVAAAALLWAVAGVLLLAPCPRQAAPTPRVQNRDTLDMPIAMHAMLGRKLAQAAQYSTNFTGITAVDYLAMYDSYTSHGFIPTSPRGYYDDATKKALYDVTFSPNASNETVIAKHALDSGAYEQQNQAAVAEGYTLRSNSPYQVAGVQYHAALWTKPRVQVAIPSNSTPQAG